MLYSQGETDGSMQISGLSSVDSLKGDSDEDTELLRGMANDARSFLTQFAWCKAIVEFYFGIGIGGIVAVFLARILAAEEDVDEWLWVVVGDLPPAYLVTDSAPTPKAAVQTYIEQMREWVAAARLGRPVQEIIPVNVPPTPENANTLNSRLDFIERELLPSFKS
jgi:hypothetical protein